MPPKIKHFLWLLNHEKTPTFNLLYQINMVDYPMCRLCNSMLKETNSHLFLLCPYVLPLSESLGIKIQIITLVSSLLHPSHWLYNFFYLYLSPSLGSLLWTFTKIYLIFYVWYIEVERNKFTFEGTPFSLSLNDVSQLTEEFWFLAGPISTKKTSI